MNRPFLFKFFFFLSIMLIIQPVFSRGIDFQFNGGRLYRTGDVPRSLCGGDFNEDGNKDILVVNYYPGDLSIYWGNGDGTLERGPSPAVLNNAHSVTVADFNHDTHEDIAVVIADNLAILLGNGDGTFSTDSVYAGSDPGDLVSGDFDEDGDLDLAFFDMDSVSVRMGYGNGLFAPAKRYHAGDCDYPFTITCGDFNQDSFEDLAVVNVNSDSISVLSGLGNGSFAPITSYSAGDWPTDITSGDFNEDGYIDIAVVNRGSETASVLLATAEGNFLPAVNYDLDATHYRSDDPIKIISADFDVDSHIDLAVTSEEGDNFAVLRGLGDGTFESAEFHDVSPGPKSITAVDLNGDSYKDLAILLEASDYISVHLGSGDGTFLSIDSYDVTAEYPGCINATDFDMDGNLDLVTANGDGWILDNLTVFMGKGDGEFLPGIEMITYSDNCGPNSIAVADYNEDGYPDMVVANYNSDNVTIMLKIPDPEYPSRFENGQNLNVGNGPVEIITSDFNEDGHADLVVSNRNSDNMSLLMGVGDGTFSSAVYFREGNYASSIRSGDFNEDGHADLVLGDRDSYNISILLGAGDGSFDSGINYIAGDGPVFVITGDFHENGHVDLAVVNRYSNDFGIYRGNGDGTFETPVYYETGLDPDGLAAGDLDLNGHLDLAVTNSSEHNITIYSGVGDGSFIAGPAFGVGSVPMSVTSGDFNNDGKPDLANANVGSWDISVLLNRTEDATAATLVSYQYLCLKNSIELWWNISEFEDGFEFYLYRSENNGEFVPLVTIGETEELSYRFVDDNINAGSSYRYRVDMTDNQRNRTLFITEEITPENPEFSLKQNYPNPFNPSTFICYSIPERSYVVIDIFDVTGRRVRRLVDSFQKAGEHVRKWTGINDDGGAVSSGVYFCRLTIGKKSITKKMVMVR